jgi:hypothetical protein
MIIVGKQSKLFKLVRVEYIAAGKAFLCTHDVVVNYSLEEFSTMSELEKKTHAVTEAINAAVKIGVHSAVIVSVIVSA